MFKFLFKSTLYVYFIKKYKTNITAIIYSVLAIIIVSLLYSDMVEYFVINDMKQDVIFLMIFKWLIYAIAVYRIYINIQRIFVGNKEDEVKVTQQLREEEKYLEDLVDSKVHQMYQSLQEKNTLKTIKESIYDKYKNQ